VRNGKSETIKQQRAEDHGRNKKFFKQENIVPTLVPEKEAGFMLPPLSLPKRLTYSTYAPSNEQQLCAIKNIRSA
jgi:hypothetical protein